MKWLHVGIGAMALSAAVYGVPAWGDVIYKLTFDNAPPGAAPATYTPGAGEVMPLNNSSATATWSAIGSGLDIIATPGGQGLQLSGGAGVRGYQNLDCPTSPAINAAGNGITLEALIKFDTNSTGDIMATGWNLYGIMGMIAGSGADAQINFGTGYFAGSTVISDPVSIVDGNFHHIAGVFSYGGQNNPATMSVYVDGQLKGTSTYTDAYTYNVNLYQSGIGNDVFPGNHDSVLGVYEAVAFADAPLSPGSFVLAVPEPTSIAGAGMVSVLLMRRRR